MGVCCFRSRSEMGTGTDFEDEIGASPRLSSSGRRACCRRAGSPIATSCGVTGMPGRTCCSPLTTMTSFAFRPSRTTRRPSTSGPSFTGRVLDLVVRADAQHELHALVGADGAVVDQQRVVLAAADELHAREHAGGETAVGVLEQAARVNGARVRVELVVEEHHVAFVRVALLIGERRPTPGFACRASSCARRAAPCRRT